MASTFDEDRRSLREETWEMLVWSVLHKTCTPFLGAGVSTPHLPLGSELATTLAEEYEYPWTDETNLARVSQYIATTRDPAFLKAQIQQHLAERQKNAAQFLHGALPVNHRRLARLELPLYITTNYDTYLQQAIGEVRQPPFVEICRWSDRLVRVLPKYRKVKPASERPTVFHLHGHMDEPSSMLITEDDYIDFTVSLAQRMEKTDLCVPRTPSPPLSSTFPEATSTSPSRREPA
jgi:hypothetical protein